MPTDPFMGMFAPKTLTDAELATALRTDAQAELDAISLYDAHMQRTTDPVIKNVLAEITNDEKDHFSKLVSALERIDPIQSKLLRDRPQAGAPILPLPPALQGLESKVSEFERRMQSPEIFVLPEPGEYTPLPPGQPAPDNGVNKLEPLADLPSASTAHIYPAILVNAEVAYSTPCTRLNIRPGHAPLIYSKGMMGALSQEQISEYCTEGFVDLQATEELRERLEVLSTSTHRCARETEGIENARSRTDAYFSCLSREIERQRRE